MAQTGAAAQAVYTQGSCARQGVSLDTDSGCGKVVQGTATASKIMATWALHQYSQNIYPNQIYYMVQEFLHYS